jgi:hypothetical protein
VLFGNVYLKVLVLANSEILSKRICFRRVKDLQLGDECCVLEMVSFSRVGIIYNVHVQLLYTSSLVSAYPAPKHPSCL